MVALSGEPNFLVLRPKPANRYPQSLSIQIRYNQASNMDITTLYAVSPDGETYTFKGTINPDEVGGTTFYVAQDARDTTLNLVRAMLSVEWIAAKYCLQPAYTSAVFTIESKGAGVDYNGNFIEESTQGYLIHWGTFTSENRDSISGEMSTAEIDVDVYTGITSQVGASAWYLDGKPYTQLRKTYASKAGGVVWFNFSDLLKFGTDYNYQSEGWFDPQTLKGYVFNISSFNGFTSKSIALSAPCFILRGNSGGGKVTDLSYYLFNQSYFNLLSNKPITPYVRGQKEYLSFILPTGVSLTNNRVRAYCYSSGGQLIKSESVSNIIPVNDRSLYSYAFSIDEYIDDERITFVDVHIVSLQSAESRDGSPPFEIINRISNAAKYEILPDCLHDHNAFVFLNAFGVWETYNFDSEVSNVIEIATETYKKAITPDYVEGAPVEVVHSAELTKQYTIEGAPVTDEVAEWLQELARAEVVIEQKTGKHVIIDSFDLSVSDENKNLHIPTIKYRYSL